MSDKAMKRIAMIDRALTTVMKVIAWAAAVFLVAVMLIAFVDAFMAKVFIRSIPHANEFIKYAGVPIVFFALAYAQMCGRHTKIELLTNKLPRSVARVLAVIMCAMGAALCFFMVWRGAVYTSETYRTGVLSGTIDGFKVYPFPAMMTLGWGMWGIAFLWDIVRTVTGYWPERPMDGPDGPEVGEGGADI